MLMCIYISGLFLEWRLSAVWRNTEAGGPRQGRSLTFAVRGLPRRVPCRPHLHVPAAARPIDAAPPSPDHLANGARLPCRRPPVHTHTHYRGSLRMAQCGATGKAK